MIGRGGRDGVGQVALPGCRSGRVGVDRRVRRSRGPVYQEDSADVTVTLTTSEIIFIIYLLDLSIIYPATIPF